MFTILFIYVYLMFCSVNPFPALQSNQNQCFSIFFMSMYINVYHVIQWFGFSNLCLIPSPLFFHRPCQKSGFWKIRVHSKIAILLGLFF